MLSIGISIDVVTGGNPSSPVVTVYGYLWFNDANNSGLMVTIGL